MNVLLLITKSEIGGAQRFVCEQAKILTDENVQVFVITNKPGWLSNNLTFINTNNLAFHPKIESRFSLSFFAYLYRFLKSNEINLVICNSANAGLYGRLVSFIIHIKSIYVSHGWSSVYNGGRITALLNFIERMLALFGSSVLCISSKDFSLAHEKIKIPEKKLYLLPNSIFPVNDTLYQQPASSTIRILTVCRLDHPKRVDLLIEAVSKIPNVHLCIIGAGKHFDSINEQIRIYKTNNITMRGEVQGFKEFHKYDIFALISESEGLPISALEAMSSGLALVLSDVGGCRSLIHNNGVVVKNDVLSIVDGINHCIDNLAEQKINSLNFFNAKFNLEKQKKKYLEYYKKVLK